MKKFILIGLSLIIGGLLIWLAEPLTVLITQFQNQQKEKNAQALAKIISPQGQVFIKKQSKNTWIKTQEVTQLYHLDSLKTEEGEVSLLFPRGYEVKLTKSTQVTLERLKDNQKDAVLAILSYGQYKIIHQGEPDSLFLSIAGKTFSPKDIMNEQASIPTSENTGVTDKNPTPTPSGSPVDQNIYESSGELSSQYIVQVVSEKKENFKRCYATLLAGNPGIKGHLVLNFTIQPEGNTNEIKVLNSTFQNQEFHDCLVTVMSRIRFAPFKAQPIIANYPIEFE